MTKLHPYFVSHGRAEESGTILVFHETAKKARSLGLGAWPGLDAVYTEMRALRAADEFMAFAESDEPHAVDSHGPGFLTWQDALADLTDRTPQEGAESDA